MSLQALQGLLGGLSQGLSGFMDQRQQAVENDQKARAIAVQEAEQKRLMQAQEWEKRRQQYQALHPDMDITPEEAQPFIADGLKFIKSETGGLRRAPSVDEKVDMMGLDLGFLRSKADALFAPQAADNTAQRAHGLQVEGIRDARAAAGDANALRIAQGHDAASMYNSNKMYDGRLATAEAQAARIEQSALNRPIDEDDYLTWSWTWKKQNKDYYNEALQSGMTPDQIDSKMRQLYLQARNPLASAQ